MKPVFLSIVNIFLISIIMGSCTANKRVIRDTTTTIVIDTIIETDTIIKEIVLPPDTVYQESEKIAPTEENSNNLLKGTLNVGPWFAKSKRSWATAGITNNIPYLKLVDLEYSQSFEIPIDKKIPVITKTETKTEYKEIIKHKPLFQNTWFYVSVVLGVLLFFFIILTIRYNH